MKSKINMTIAVLACLQFATCQEVEEQDYNITVRVTDSEGTPISGAMAKFGMLKWVNPATMSTRMEEVPAPASNDKGEIHAHYKSIPHLNGGPMPGAYVTRPMFYPTKAERGRWLTVGPGKWKAEVVVTMKPVKNPIAMIFHRECALPLLEKSKAYGYDLELGAPVAPYGTGKVADIEVMLEGTRSGDNPELDQDIDFKASIRFPNPHDGLYEFPSNLMIGATGSAFISDYLAPEGGYKSALGRNVVWGRARAGVAYWEYEHALEKKGYYFRIRTKTDGAGNITSCHYGKIYGPVTLLPGLRTRVNPPAAHEATLHLREVYFNPTSNDRNVECDTTVNLSKKLDEYGKPIQIDRP